MSVDDFTEDQLVDLARQSDLFKLVRTARELINMALDDEVPRGHKGRGEWSYVPNEVTVALYPRLELARRTFREIEVQLMMALGQFKRMDGPFAIRKLFVKCRRCFFAL